MGIVSLNCPTGRRRTDGKMKPTPLSREFPKREWDISSGRPEMKKGYTKRGLKISRQES
jgi:hypothetical protein